ncbi:MAG: hypothetical protein AAB546_01265 [Patescibacteria group bacterium]
MAKIEGFRERLVTNREVWMKQHPDYSSPEATAAVAMDSALEAVFDLGFSNQAKEIIKNGELLRRNNLISNTAAYERFGTWWKKVIEEFKSSELGDK